MHRVSKCEGKNIFEEIVSPSPKTTDYFDKATNIDIFPETQITEDKNIDFISYLEYK